MLWKYTLPYSGYIEAPADINQARKLLAEKIRSDPMSLIQRLEPAESPSSLWGMVFGTQKPPGK